MGTGYVLNYKIKKMVVILWQIIYTGVDSVHFQPGQTAFDVDEA